MFPYCFCRTSHIIKWGEFTAKQRVPQTCFWGIRAAFTRSTNDWMWSTRGSGICMTSLFLNTRSSEPLMPVSAFWGWQIFVSCFSLGLWPWCSPPWPLYVPQRLQRGPQLIAQIIKFNIYLNKYNQPAVWQGTQFIKSPCLFVVSLIKI